MWEQIRSNQIRSVMLVFFMGALLLGVGYALGYGLMGNGTGGLIIAAIIWLIMNLVGYFQGDGLMLSMNRARKIRKADHPRLWNIVEEMQIASGLERMPDIYIIDDPALNAFATGRDPKRAAVAVTSGLLAHLNRDELQGVIAHEMAHVKNRDVLLMVMAGILLGSIVILAWYGSRIMLFGGMGGRSRGSGGGGGGAAIIMIVAIVLAILAPIFAQLIYYAISRRREYLADATGALYTRYPEGLASALEKIAGSTAPLKAANKATAPMYIINPFRAKGRAATNLSSTHPPISERIQILRNMGGGGLGDYEVAYAGAHRGGGHVIPATALAGAATVPLRQATVETAAEKADHVKRTREASAALWSVNKYRTLDCECGTRLRIPPGYRQPKVKCPHCGRVHDVLA